MTVGQQHGDRARQYRHYQHQQVSGDQPGPDKQRHFHQRHPRCAHVENGGDDIDRAHDGGGSQDVDCENHHVHTHAHLHRQWRIECPTTSTGTARYKKCRYQQQCRRRQQPETPVVHASKSHVRSADHHRYLPIGKTNKGRHNRAEHHYQAVICSERVKKLRGH